MFPHTSVEHIHGRTMGCHPSITEISYLILPFIVHLGLNPIAPRLTILSAKGLKSQKLLLFQFSYDGFKTRLAKRREILIFPRMAGNTGNSREILVIPGNYWEICPSSIKKF